MLHDVDLPKATEFWGELEWWKRGGSELGVSKFFVKCTSFEQLQTMDGQTDTQARRYLPLACACCGLGIVNSVVGLETRHSGQSSPVLSGRDRSSDSELDHWKGGNPTQPNQTPKRSPMPYSGQSVITSRGGDQALPTIGHQIAKKWVSGLGLVEA